MIPSPNSKLLKKYPESFRGASSLIHRTVMKRQLLALTLALGALLPMSSRADSEVSFQFFYDNLSPHGEWVDVGDYGTCWRPNDVDEEWSPYTDGYWSYTDAGWTWVSYEDFGDITYHYGRWVSAEDVGWCWVPDYEWGPAWVSWRSDDDYVGWAPLPPEAHFQASVGFGVWSDDYYDIGPSYYNFCPVVEFGAPVIRSVCVPRVSVLGIFGRSVNITNFSYNGYHSVPFCGGPSFSYINSRCRRPVPALKLVQNTTIINNNYTVINNRRVLKAPRNSVAGNTLNVFAPKVVKNTNNLIKPQVTKVVAKDKVRRGWDGVKDQGEAKQLREKVKNQAKGLNPDTAPAKPVQTADLKPLPEKADPSAPSVVARPNNRPKNDRDNDGIPNRKDKDIAGQPDRPGKDKPADVPGTTDDRPGRGNKGKGDIPDAPVAGVDPNQPDAPDRPAKNNRPNADDKPNRVAGEAPGANDDKPNRKGQDGLRKPFKADQPDNRVADDQPGQPGVDAPDRPQGGGQGKGKKAQNDAQDAIDREQRQQRQRMAEQETQRNQAEKQQQRQEAARMEQQRENAQRMERQREAGRQQEAGNEARRQQEARQEQAQQQARQQQRALEAQQQQRQQQRAVEAQRQQQAQRQFQQQQQRQQQVRQQPQPQPQPQRQQPQQFQQPPQRQYQNPGNGGGGGGGGARKGGGGGGGGRQLSPEEAQQLRKAQRGF